MDKCRGLECLARALLCEPLRRQLAQFVVDERKQLLSGCRIASGRLRQDSRDFLHDHALYHTAFDHAHGRGLPSACSLQLKAHRYGIMIGAGGLGGARDDAVRALHILLGHGGGAENKVDRRLELALVVGVGQFALEFGGG